MCQLFIGHVLIESAVDVMFVCGIGQTLISSLNANASIDLLSDAFSDVPAIEIRK